MVKLAWEMENVDQKHKVSVLQNEFTSYFPMTVIDYLMEMDVSLWRGIPPSLCMLWILLANKETVLSL